MLVDTAIQPAVYAPWNVVAEKGRTYCRGKILSGFRKPQNPSKTAPGAYHFKKK